jgi:hypothetical protein
LRVLEVVTEAKTFYDTRPWFVGEKEMCKNEWDVLDDVVVVVEDETDDRKMRSERIWVFVFHLAFIHGFV